MKKVMICQPMTGRSNEEISSERSDLIDILEEQGYEVLDTLLTENDVEKDEPIYYLVKSLEYLAEADILYCMKGWEQARGCRIEHMIAEEYGKEIIEV